ncbi:MAG: ABC transporter ATP-binding protein [Defluviitaleaceae bacterium]|nr:ABC transporter ATP-binding protein [Defluviitaleaceae bacterium]
MLATMKNVTKRYGNQTVVNQLDLTVKSGEILGLLGPNGAGKSTTINMLCGLINADEGEVMLFEQKQHTKNLSTRHELGLVTQDITLFSGLNVVENLRYVGGLYGLRGAELNARVSDVLDFIELRDHRKKKPKQLSGGMQRRLNIGCALLHQPKLIIMDEPTVGIDPQSRNHILESVKKLAANGTTVIYTSHYMEEVEAVCDRIIIMDLGRIIAQGTVNELIKNTGNESTVILTAIAPSPALTRALEEVPGVRQVNMAGNKYTIISAANSGNISRITELAGQHGGFAGITEQARSLEDIFLTLTGKSLREGNGYA